MGNYHIISNRLVVQLAILLSATRCCLSQTVQTSGYLSLRIWSESSCSKWVQTIIYTLGKNGCVNTLAGNLAAPGTSTSLRARITDDVTVTLEVLKYDNGKCGTLLKLPTVTRSVIFKYAKPVTKGDLSMLINGTKVGCAALGTQSFYFGTATWTDTYPIPREDIDRKPGYVV